MGNSVEGNMEREHHWSDGLEDLNWNWKVKSKKLRAENAGKRRL